MYKTYKAIIDIVISVVEPNTLGYYNMTEIEFAITLAAKDYNLNNTQIDECISQFKQNYKYIYN